jgi:hypothetical protein
VFEQFIGENSQLFRLLDPAGDNQLVAALRGSLDTVVQSQNEAILGQFSLDNKNGALVRFLGELTAKHGDLNQALSRDMQAIVAEFSLDKEDSALSRLVSRVEAAQKSLNAELSLDNQDSALQRLHRPLVGPGAEGLGALLLEDRELPELADQGADLVVAHRRKIPPPGSGSHPTAPLRWLRSIGAQATLARGSAARMRGGTSRSGPAGP